jgi:hypothetical protein
MKALQLFGLLVGLQFVSLQAYAFVGQDQFKVELVKPWGEFGLRALGKGKNLTEIRLDCSKTSDMGLIVTLVNNYGKTSNIVLPASKLGSDKNKCHQNLKNYFASVYSKRGVASFKDKSHVPRIVDLNFDQGVRTLSFR